MAAIQATGVRELIEAAVTSISVLGGSMAYFSGFAAAQVTACIAILGFGLAPKMLVPIAWTTFASYTALSTWVERRLGRR